MTQKTITASLRRASDYDPRVIFLKKLLVNCVIPFWTVSLYVVEASLEAAMFLLQPPKCWDYSCVPPCLPLFLVVRLKKKCQFWRWHH